MLSAISRSRSIQGFTPSETATFVFSLKPALFQRLRDELGKDAGTPVRGAAAGGRAARPARASTPPRCTRRAARRSSCRQQQDMLELSTPVVKLWDGILALPLIGTLDSARTQVVMETLLQRIVETGAEVAIIDITGVPDRGHARRPAPAQDRDRRPADGRRVHHQRHPAADRADDRAPRRRPRRRDHQGDAGRRLRHGAQAAQSRRRPRRPPRA